MQKVISAVVTFVNGFLIYALLYHVQGLDAGKASAWFTEPASVPLILLLGMPPIYLFGLWLIAAFFLEVGEERVVFPRLWAEEMETPALTWLWETLSGLFALALPPRRSSSTLGRCSSRGTPGRRRAPAFARSTSGAEVRSRRAARRSAPSATATSGPRRRP